MIEANDKFNTGLFEWQKLPYIPLLPPNSSMDFPNRDATFLPTIRPTFSLPVNDTMD